MRVPIYVLQVNTESLASDLNYHNKSRKRLIRKDQALVFDLHHEESELESMTWVKLVLDSAKIFSRNFARSTFYHH